MTDPHGCERDAGDDPARAADAPARPLELPPLAAARRRAADLDPSLRVAAVAAVP